MTKLFFEGQSNSGESDLFMYDGSGLPVDLTASFDAGNGGLVDGYDNEIGALGVDAGPEMAGAGSNVFFAGNYKGLETLLTYNETTGKITAFNPADAWGSGTIPQDLIADGSEVYFVGINAQEDSTLWESNGTKAGTKQIAHSAFDDGDMTRQGALLYFRDGGRLESYNTSTGAFAAVAHSGGIRPRDVLSALSSGSGHAASTNLFLAGTDSLGHQNIYLQNGAGLVEIKSNVDPSEGMDPYALTALSASTGSGVFFSGVDNANGDRGLYFVSKYTGSGAHQAIDVASSSSSGVANLDPYDLTAFNGEMYFTGDDSFSSGRGLFVYDPANHTTTELIHSNQLDLSDGYAASWGSANAPTMAVYDNELFFGAANPNASGAASVPQLYEYSGSGSTATLISVNSQGETFGGMPANLIKL